jgi:lipopolysaccharide/colanic/teichoic acid biosynthesis glycosyltransferase
MLKSIFDFSIIFILLPVLIPIFILLVLFSLILNGRPIFFLQERGGYKGKKIKIIKFRTIEEETGKINFYSNFLRFTKLDELPQLINIFKGELSLVGPRPLFYEYKKLYKKKHLKRFLIKPGITGWSQIKSTHTTSWSKKFDYDIWYINNRSFFLDLKIIIITIKNIIIFFFNKNKTKNYTQKFNGNN